MRELELNTIMGVVSDPIKSRLNINDKKLASDLERLIHILEIGKTQGIKHKLFAIKNMATMRLMMSNN